MKVKRFVFQIVLSFVVLGLGGGPATPQQGGSAPRRVIIFVWDGLRADDVTPENMPNYFALARRGRLRDHHASIRLTMLTPSPCHRAVSGEQGSTQGWTAECQGKTQGVAIILLTRRYGTSGWWKRSGLVSGQADAVCRNAPSGEAERADDSGVGSAAPRSFRIPTRGLSLTRMRRSR